MATEDTFGFDDVNIEVPTPTPAPSEPILAEPIEVHPSNTLVDEDDTNDLASLSEFEDSTLRETPVEFITGAAGTGKTHEIKRRVAEDRRYGVLCASTGIAAVNLNAQTINSLLKYYDTASLKDNYTSGRLQATLRRIAATGVRNIILDEVSMTSNEQLDIFYMALGEINQRASLRHPLGLILLGDFCQLPPIKAKYAFEAACWPKFQEKTTRLTKVWRQSDLGFLNAINFLRAGEGKKAAEILREIIKFYPGLDDHFDGTTIMGKNEEVDRYNNTRLMELKGKVINLRSRFWGDEDKGSWKNIPAEFFLKEGAYVMSLTNSGADLEFANGDTGHVRDFDGKAFNVELVRNDACVQIYPIHRTKVSRDIPAGVDPDRIETFSSKDGERPPYGRVSYDETLKVWHVGGIQYYPLRPAYATTNHKCQGLSIDRAQIDIRNSFFGQPAMTYVSVSRCRTPEGLRIVGTPDLLAKRCSIDELVRPWL